MLENIPVREIAFTSLKGIVGTSAFGTVSIIASLEAVTVWVKFAGIVGGVACAVATFISICFDIRKKWKDRNRKFRNNIGRDAPRDGGDE